MTAQPQVSAGGEWHSCRFLELSIVKPTRKFRRLREYLEFSCRPECASRDPVFTMLSWHGLRNTRDRFACLDNLLNLVGVLACWPIRSLTCFDFLLDTVPFSFDDPAVNHRRVVLFRWVPWRVGASQKYDPRERLRGKGCKRLRARVASLRESLPRIATLLRFSRQSNKGPARCLAEAGVQRRQACPPAECCPHANCDTPLERWE